MTRILIVEDDKYLNKLLSDRFLRDGFDVETALEGNAGWIKLVEADESNKPFNILLCDLLLPKLMGEELFKRIRASDSFKDLRLIAMSGIFKDEDQVKSFSEKYNLDGYWVKPFEFNDLVNSITGKVVFQDKEKSFSGSISQTPMEKVYLQAYEQGFTGLLTLEQENSKRKVYFSNGFPVAAESSIMSESLGHSLVGMKLIDEDSRESASKRMIEENIQLGQMLIKMGVLTKDQLFDGIRRHTFKLLLNCFTWRSATFHTEPLESLPSYVVHVEFNPLLIILKAQKIFYSKEGFDKLVEDNKKKYCHKSERMFQILPLLDLDKSTHKFFKDFSGEKNLGDLIDQVPDENQEDAVRIFFLLKSLDLIEWRDTPVKDNPSDFKHIDFEEEFEKEHTFPKEKEKQIQSAYVELIGKNYFQMLSVTQQASSEEVEAAYKKVKSQFDLNQLGSHIPGQVLRIIDDIHTRLEQAYQVLSREKSKKKYTQKILRDEKASLDDSKAFLKAQELFRKGKGLLQNKNYSQAEQVFLEAVHFWNAEINFRLYACYSELKKSLEDEDPEKAERCLQRLKGVSDRMPNSETTHLLLAQSFQAFGQKGLAKLSFEKVLDINPECDEASYSLIELSKKDEQRKIIKQRIRKTSKPAKYAVFYALILGIGLILAYAVKDQLAFERGIVDLETDEFKLIIPNILEIKQKNEVAKFIIQEGWISKVPENVLTNKCNRSLIVAEGYGISSIHIYEFNSGLKAICSKKALIRY